MPDHLRSGVEHLSRLTLGDVRVHYNSTEPARHQALAYTKGRDIHLGPGQEQHLPHEAWHAVQQRQGRVEATRQVGGDRINDDPALEKEAEVMGSRALRLHAKEPPATGALQMGQLVPATPVMQMVYKVTADEKELETLRKWPSVAAVFNMLDWKPILDQTYSYIEDVEKSLGDDSGRDALTEEEAEVDNLAEVLDQLTKDFVAAPALDEAPVHGTRKRKKTQNDRKWELSSQINVKAKALFERFGLIQTAFPLNTGGFSAKGRAHDLEESTAPQVGFKKMTDWFSGITLGDMTLSDSKSVYKHPDRMKVDEQAGAPTLPSDLAGLSEANQLTTLETRLDDLETPQTINSGRAPRTADREGGQIKNMKGANASAYAKLAGIAGWETTRWEWLHVRAASLGGETNGKNLVVGTRDVNTQMMPFESNIRLLGNIVEENPDRYKRLVATFKVEGQDNPAKHKVDTIEVDWKLVKAEKALDSVQDIKGKARFSPLKRDTSISKTEIGILETVLREERQKATAADVED